MDKTRYVLDLNPIMQLIEKLLEFIYQVLVLFKLDHRSWLVKVFVLSGICLLTRSIWGVLIERLLIDKYGIKIPDAQPHGWILILIGLIIFLLNRHDLLKLNTWHTEQTSQIISLGANRVAINFSQPMRCTPTLKFSDLPAGVQPRIENWTHNGFTVEFIPNNINVKSFSFTADSKPGLPWPVSWIYNKIRSNA